MDVGVCRYVCCDESRFDALTQILLFFSWFISLLSGKDRLIDGLD